MPSEGPVEMMLVPVPKESSSLPSTDAAAPAVSAISDTYNVSTNTRQLPGKMVLKMDYDDDDNNEDQVTQNAAPSKYRPPAKRSSNTTGNSSNRNVPIATTNATGASTSRPRSRGNSFDNNRHGKGNRSRASSHDYDPSSSMSSSMSIDTSSRTTAVPIDRKVNNPKPITQLSPNSMEKAIASTNFEVHLGNSPTQKVTKNGNEGMTASASSTNNSNSSNAFKKAPLRQQQKQQQQHQQQHQPLIQPYELKQSGSKTTSISSSPPKGGSVGSIFTNLKTGDKKKSIYKITSDV